MSRPAQAIMQRLNALAKISDAPGQITRLFASDAMRRANALVGTWMRAAGMNTRLDALGYLIGHYPAARPGAKILLLGSHLDTVRNAGKFDGPLGVLLAIACVQQLHQAKIHLPFAIKVIGFSDEEGVRYQTTYLGSKALAGSFSKNDLRRQDAGGISLADALKTFGGNPARLKSARLDPRQLLGYVEAHIEQGPVLEKKRLAVGLVTSIAGQSRARVRFTGRAGHAGTTPMNGRQDALCAAAELILAAENLARKTPGAVATVGEVSARPGASNVIPGEVWLTLDVRHARDAVRESVSAALKREARQIARRRKLRLVCETVHAAAAVNCCPRLSRLLGQSVRRRQGKLLRLPSGAGHDAAVMAAITPVAMLFVRCKNGLSHHPDESVKTADVGLALKVLNDFLTSLAALGDQGIARRRSRQIKAIL